MSIRIISKCLGLAFISAVAFALAEPSLLKAESSIVVQGQQAGSLDTMNLKPYIETYAEVVYRNYRDTREQAAVMRDALAAFLDQPNEDTHKAAKAAWIKARQSYLQTEAFRFYEGPIDFIDEETGAGLLYLMKRGCFLN